VIEIAIAKRKYGLDNSEIQKLSKFPSIKTAILCFCSIFGMLVWNLTTNKVITALEGIQLRFLESQKICFFRNYPLEMGFEMIRQIIVGKLH